jgi:serine/threonine-protein kinase
MKLNTRTNNCDRDRLESLLGGKLSEAEERDLALHLNTCDDCRGRLQDRAAAPEIWMEAERLLKATEYDLPGGQQELDSQRAGRPSRQPVQIQAVLDALAPTDDPQMLGRLGAYEVSGVVGAGGMGVVLKAIDRSLDRTVAIKVLAPHLAASGAARKRFAREAKAAAAVLHPNVIAIHSVSNDEELPYLVMPYLRGASLQKRLDCEGPISLQEVLRIGSQISAGLAAAHAQGLVHRDIKPANILLEDGVERVAITDFGLARAVNDATITHSGVIAGTPQYMSPEQARGEGVDARSDLFSLGSVLYAMCTGRPPFRAETTYGVMRRITDDQPTPIGDINPDIPEWLCSIIAKLMSKPAGDRFASAAAVTQLLEQCLAHVQQPAAVPLPNIPLLTLREKGAKRPPKGYRKGVIAMIAVLGFLGLGLWLSADAPDISGRWKGDEWGEVVLKQRDDGAYEGTYTDTYGNEPGGLELTWSRVERRFKGTWREGKDRFGKIAVRKVGDDIRGAWTTNEKSSVNPGTPELADLLWVRPVGTTTELEGDWRLDSITGGGVKGWEQNLTARVRGNRWTTIRPKSETPHRLVLNANETPKTIDMILEEESRPPVIYRGLYHLHGDTLTIAWGSPASERPTGFEGIDAGVHTWKRIAETKTSATTSNSAPPIPARAGSEIAFGPVVEKILVHDGKVGTPSVFLDLDTGRSASMELKAGRKKIFRWAREAGMDLEFTGFSPNVGLLGWRLLVRKVDEGKWDKTNANELLNEPALADNMRPTRSTGDALSPTITDRNDWDLFAAPKFFKSGTYYFRTNEDGRGIVQVSVSEEPHGVKIRYKLLQRPDQKRNSVSTGDSTAPTDPRKPKTPIVGPPADADDPPPPAGVLTASQAVEQGNALYHSRKKVTVRFRVESVTHGTLRDEQGKESKRWNLSSKAASDRVDPTAFSVLLSPEAEAALDQRGVRDIARHYLGRLIEVEGVVYGVGLELVSQPDTVWTYHMDVNSLDQIRMLDSPPQRPAATAEVRRGDGAESAGFSETKEVVLSMGSSKFMLDLDTGNTMDPPARVGRPEQEQMDLQTDQVQPYHYPTKLIGLGLMGREVKASSWNSSASDVRRVATHPLKEMDVGPEQNPTYFFRTRDGTHGILQLLEIVEASKGIRLRYKTLAEGRAKDDGKETTAAESGTGDPKATPPTPSQVTTTTGPGANARPTSPPRETKGMPQRLINLQINDRVKLIACSTDGKQIAIANGNPTLVLRTDRTSRVTDNWKPSVEIMEGIKRLGERGVISLDLTTDEEDAVLAATPRVSHFEVTALEFSPDGSLLAVGTSIGQVKLFDATTGELVQSLDDEQARLADKVIPDNWKPIRRAMGSVASLAFSPDGTLLAVCGSSFGDYSDIFDGVDGLGRLSTGPGRLKVWNVTTGALKHDLAGHSHAYDVAFSPDGTVLASAGSWGGNEGNGTGVITWNTEEGKKESAIAKEANAGVHAVAFSPTRKMVAIAAVQYDKENAAYSTAIIMAFPLSGITEWQQTIPGWANPKAFTPDGRSVAVFCGGESIRFINVETGQTQHEIKPQQGGRWTDFAIAPSAQMMFIGRSDGERKGGIEFWKLDSDGAPAD